LVQIVEGVQGCRPMRRGLLEFWWRSYCSGCTMQVFADPSSLHQRKEVQEDQVIRVAGMVSGILTG
jgi:hypothetical protein